MDPSLASQAPTLDVDILIAQLQAIVADPKGATVALAIDDTKRQQLKQLARAASFALEEPFETVQRLVYSVSLTTPARRHCSAKMGCGLCHTACVVQREI